VGFQPAVNSIGRGNDIIAVYVAFAVAFFVAFAVAFLVVIPEGNLLFLSISFAIFRP